MKPNQPLQTTTRSCPFSIIFQRCDSTVHSVRIVPDFWRWAKKPMAIEPHHSESKIKPYRWCIGVGLFLGVISSQLGYGAGGGIILSITIGTLGFITTSGPQRTAKVFYYCASLWASFFTFGFHSISEPLSIHTVYVTIGVICIPTGIAFAITKSLDTVASRSRARNEKWKQSRTSHYRQRGSLFDFKRSAKIYETKSIPIYHD